MTDGTPIASVVIAVKGDDRARRTVDRLLRQTATADSYEVVVVENGTRDLADLDGRDGIVRHLHVPVANKPAALNVGVAAARGRYLLFTDADCVPEPDWVENMTRALSTGGAAIVGGVIGKYNPRTWTQRHSITVVDGQLRLNYLPALHLPYVVGANSGVDARALREVGGFDEELRSGSDVDICYKLGLRGHTVTLAHDALVWHEDRSTVGAHFRRFRHYAIYQVLLFAKYRPVSGKRFVVDPYPFRRAADALRYAPRAAARLISGDRAPASRAMLQLVEAAGVLAGEVEGAIRFRQLYL